MKKIQFENMRLKKATRELIEEFKKIDPDFEIKKYKGKYVRVIGADGEYYSITTRFKNQKEVCDHITRLIRESHVEKIILGLSAETSVPLTTDVVYCGESRDSIRVYYEKLTEKQFKKILETLKTFTKEDMEEETQKSFKADGKMIVLRAEKLTEKYTHFTLDKASIKTNACKTTTTTKETKKMDRKFTKVVNGEILVVQKEIKAEVIRYITLCEDIYDKDFDKNIQVNINSRLSSTLGYFRYCGKKPISIDISEILIKAFEEELVSDVIGHEVAHYIMHLLGNFSENHGKKFKSLCKKLGVNGNATSSTEKFVRKDYIEYKKKEILEKHNKSRYALVCPHGCNRVKYFKVAKKGSISRWVNNYSCPEHGCCLVCYDRKEKIKYWAEVWSFTNPIIAHEPMTKEEIEKYC